MRPLGILAVKDRIVQRAVYDAIAPRFERKFLDCSFGFREGRSTQDAATRVSELRQRGLRWIVDGDIKNCFENLDHRLLLRAAQAEIRDTRVLRLIEQWLKAQIFNEMNGRDLSVGTFQGGILSPLLANIYLHEFDLRLTHARHHLVRYADDWLISCRTQREAEGALENAKRALEAIRLAINPYKTHIVNFEQGFKFVGRFFVRDEVFNLAAADCRPLMADR
jgi:group II intron reverse transcriptase/maturase